MPPVRLNRRRFLGCSAAAGWALSQGVPVDAADAQPIGIGVIGAGNRGTALLRELLQVPTAPVVAVCDAEPKHRLRAQGIAEKAQHRRPVALEHPDQLLERDDVTAVVVALPCDLHAEVYGAAIRAQKHLYAEKPLALTLSECDALIAESERAPDVVVHVGYQRRSNPRYREGVSLLKRGELGELIEARAHWSSSNGPMSGHRGWLASRARSGDWMVEQAVHVWDLLCWIAGGPPARSFGHGRRNLFAQVQPERDVTDHYSAWLEWPNGFHASFTQSWVDPADDAFTGNSQRIVGTAGGVDFSTGAITFRDKSRGRVALPAGPQPDTRLALDAFLSAIRADSKPEPPVTLADARAATVTGLLVRKAVDERRVVKLEEITSEA
jgi:predicted dehydrogenase